jgi:hypothetical protein
MQLIYDEKAKKTGSYIIGASGWDSIPCDFGISFLKDHFDGTLCYAETFAQIKRGEAVSVYVFLNMFSYRDTFLMMVLIKLLFWDFRKLHLTELAKFADN